LVGFSPWIFRFPLLISKDLVIFLGWIAAAFRSKACSESSLTVSLAIHVEFRCKMPTPFRSSHAIYIREAANPANLGKNEIPEVLMHRLLSVRAFDVHGMIIDADVIDGERLESLIKRMLANDCVEYLHIHNAKLGCYLALAERG
jgi:hypothetical protein